MAYTYINSKFSSDLFPSVPSFHHFVLFAVSEANLGWTHRKWGQPWVNKKRSTIYVAPWVNKEANLIWTRRPALYEQGGQPYMNKEASLIWTRRPTLYEQGGQPYMKKEANLIWTRRPTLYEQGGQPYMNKEANLIWTRIPLYQPRLSFNYCSPNNNCNIYKTITEPRDKIQMRSLSDSVIG